MAHAVRRIEHDAQFMRAAEIAGVADDEAVGHVALRTKRGYATK